MIHDNNGFAEGETCDTRGYKSILTKNECAEAVKGIPKIKDWVIQPGETPCVHNGIGAPNHCWLVYTPGFVEVIMFTQGNCPVHNEKFDPLVRLICRKK